MTSEQRWTRPRADGKLHSNEPVQCAHCEHWFQNFNYVEILKHFRENHKEFYKMKWETEIVPSGQHKMYPQFEPHQVSDPNTPEAQAYSKQYWEHRRKIKPV